MTGIRLDDLLELTSEIVAAHVSNNDNEVAIEDLPSLIDHVHRALHKLSKAAPAVSEERRPAVPVASSVKPDYLVCLEDGRKLKMLKRHLMARYGMTAAEYRAKWNLPADYPMIAPNYATARGDIARRTGLGRRNARSEQTQQIETSRQAEEAIADRAGMVETAMPGKTSTVETSQATSQPVRRKLLRPVFSNKSAPEPQPVSKPDAVPDNGWPKQPLDILRDAIARQSCVTATYNKRTMILAPHILYTRHDEPYLRAVTVALDGRSPRELKLGTFKVAGLGELVDSAGQFVQHPDFSPANEDYQGVTLAAIASSPARHPAQAGQRFR